MTLSWINFSIFKGILGRIIFWGHIMVIICFITLSSKTKKREIKKEKRDLFFKKGEKYGGKEERKEGRMGGRNEVE